MKRVVFNQKGGVGKSSICVNLAALSASHGLRTLVVDLDPQANSSHYLGVDAEHGETSVGDLLKHSVGWFGSKPKAHSFVTETEFEHLDLLAATPELTVLERELESRYKIFKLRDALNELSDQYHRIYIDTPPNFNFYSKSALIAADSVLIPFDCDGFSAQAITRLMDNMLELRADHNPELALEGVIVNQFNPQANFPRQLVESLKAQQLPVLESYLGSSVKMRESHQAQVPLVWYAPRHKLSGQFAALFDQLELELAVS